MKNDLSLARVLVNSFAYEGEDKDEGEDEAESDDEYGDDDAVDALAGTINGCTNHRLMYLRVNIHMHDVEIRIGGASRICRLHRYSHLPATSKLVHIGYNTSEE